MTTVQLDFPQLLKWILGVIPYLKYIYNKIYLLLSCESGLSWLNMFL